MIDEPGRREERFPARKEGVVRERITRQLEEWDVGKGDLAICGGARGADILFGELCADRGAELWLLLALPESEFLKASVRLPDSNWEQRFFALRDRERVKVLAQGEGQKSQPVDPSVFSQANRWIINTGLAEAKDPKNLYALLIWNEEPEGDGAGGTADFASRVKELGAHQVIINPT